MVFTGERMTAAEAFRIGLIERLVPKGEALAEARNIAFKILTNSPSAITYAKAAINRGLDSTLSAGLLIEQESFGEVCAIGDQIEGARAFLGKSKPKFL
jgi:enoyl-CoA hydratase